MEEGGKLREDGRSEEAEVVDRKGEGEGRRGLCVWLLLPNGGEPAQLPGAWHTGPPDGGILIEREPGEREADGGTDRQGRA